MTMEIFVINICWNFDNCTWNVSIISKSTKYFWLNKYLKLNLFTISIDTDAADANYSLRHSSSKTDNPLGVGEGNIHSRTHQGERQFQGSLGLLGFRNH